MSTPSPACIIFRLFKMPIITGVKWYLILICISLIIREIGLIIFFAVKDGEALHSQQKQDWELTVAQIKNSFIAKFRLKVKKVGKTTRPFRCDLNQTPYDYIVEVRNRFKGLGLIDRVTDELWTEVRDIVQETGIKIITKKKNAEEQNGCLRRPYK